MSASALATALTSINALERAPALPALGNRPILGDVGMTYRVDRHRERGQLPDTL